ncbi:hypothetical protein PanWU01x14_023050, partial [Parasponia andersonii]
FRKSKTKNTYQWLLLYWDPNKRLQCTKSLKEFYVFFFSLSLDAKTEISVFSNNYKCVLFMRRNCKPLLLTWMILQMPHSFSAITTKTSFTDHLCLLLFDGGLIIALSA